MSFLNRSLLSVGGYGLTIDLMTEIAASEKLSRPDPGSGSLDQWDRDHSWHPFTQMAEYAHLPQLHVERGEGCWVYDVEGNRYLDGNASIWTNVHGHNNVDLNAALEEQASKIAHSTYLGLSHSTGAELGKKLVEISPRGLDRVVFSDNGSNAIEIALKLSFQYWQLTGKPEKRLVVGLSGGYHGDTFGAMSVGDSGSFHERFKPWQFESLQIPTPLCQEVAGVEREADFTRSLSALEALLADRSDEVAAVIMEPWVQGAAGMRMQPRGFLKAVEGLCRRWDAHLILDEVFVAFGRMGGMFVCEQESVRPDFLCLAKGLSAGYLPLAATLTSDSVFEAFLGDFDSGKGFYHGHTFTANPLAAAVSLASIQKLEKLIASGKVEETIQRFGNAIRDTFGGHPNVKTVRQRGLAAAIDLYPGGALTNSWPLNNRTGMAVCLNARKRGVLLRPLLDSILIVPPIVISHSEIDFLCANLKTTIDETLIPECSQI